MVDGSWRWSGGVWSSRKEVEWRLGKEVLTRSTLVLFKYGKWACGSWAIGKAGLGYLLDQCLDLFYLWIWILNFNTKRVHKVLLKF